MESEIIVLLVFMYLCFGWLIWVWCAAFDYVFNDNVEPDLLMFMLAITFFWFLMLCWIAVMAGKEAAIRTKRAWRKRRSSGVI